MPKLILHVKEPILSKYLYDQMSQDSFPSSHSYHQLCKLFAMDFDTLTAGPSPRFKKWSGGRHGRVPKARVGESTRGGTPPLEWGVQGSPPRKF